MDTSPVVPRSLTFGVSLRQHVPCTATPAHPRHRSPILGAASNRITYNELMSMNIFLEFPFCCFGSLNLRVHEPSNGPRNCTPILHQALVSNSLSGVHRSLAPPLRPPILQSPVSSLRSRFDREGLRPHAPRYPNLANLQTQNSLRVQKLKAQSQEMSISNPSHKSKLMTQNSEHQTLNSNTKLKTHLSKLQARSKS